MLTVGVITDFHFGPDARFGGKLRKLSRLGPALLQGFVQRMNDEVRPDLVLNLGDDIEDEAPELDRARYAEAMRILGGSRAPVLHVAGNHDVALLEPAELRSMWGLAPDGPLYRAETVRGVEIILLYTHETKDVSVTIDDEQLAWLERRLGSGAGPAVVFMHHSAADQELSGNRWFERAPHICLVRERKRLRAILERSGRVQAVINGHLHWNQLTVHAGIPYVTLQSPIENLDEDAPGRPAACFGVLRVMPQRLSFEVHGTEAPLRYQWPPPPPPVPSGAPAASASSD